MRRTLLDTECWLWWHLSPERLGRSAMALFALLTADPQLFDYDPDLAWAGPESPPRRRSRRRT